MCQSPPAPRQGYQSPPPVSSISGEAFPLSPKTRKETQGSGPDLTLWGPRAPRYVGAPRKMKNEIMVGKNGYFYQSKRLSKKTLDLHKYKTILTHN